MRHCRRSRDRRAGRPGVPPRSPSGSPACAGGVDDGGKKCPRGGVVADELFGMPLHRDDEAAAVGVLEGLDHIVGSPADVTKIAAQAMHGLVMEAVHAQLRGPEDRAEPRALGLQLHVVRGDVAPGGLAVLNAVAERVGDVLMDAAAEGDVEHLQAATDGEHRHVVAQRAPAYRPTATVQAIGSRWAVAAGHPLAAEAAAHVLGAGGNAIDAGVAAGLTLGVVHPDMVSVAGVAPILVHLARTGETFQVSGVGPYPRASTLEYFRGLGNQIPPGLARTVVPAAPAAWCAALA